MDCTIRVAKTKALISFAVTTKLICVFVFAYAKSRFLFLHIQKAGFLITRLNWANPEVLEIGRKTDKVCI